MITEIKLERDGPRAIVSGLPPAVIEQLQVRVCGPVTTAAGTIRAEFSCRPLLRDVWSPFHGDGVFACAAGLAAVVARMLDRLGYTVAFRGFRLVELPEIDPVSLGHGPVDQGFLEATRRHSHLLVRHGAGVEVHAVVIMVALAWPTRRVVVAVARVDEARRLAVYLRAAGVDAALATHRHVPRDDAPVVVATLGQLGRNAVGLHNLDILLLGNAVEAIATVGRSVLHPDYWPGSVRVPRVVGMVPAGRRLAPSDRIGLVEICGPHVYRLVALGVTERPVTYAMVPIWGGTRKSYR